MIGLEGGEPDHNGTRWNSQLIRRKGRLPNRRMHTIQRLGRQFSRADVGGSRHLTQSTGRLQPAGSPMAAIRGTELGSSSLYRPRANLAMLHRELAKLMRMSTRNMW